MAMTPLTGMPDRTQDQSTFTANCNDFFTAKLPLFVTEANALQADVDAKKTLAETAATTATTQAGTATTQAGIATAQSTLAANWATQLGTPVSGGEYSAKYHAQAAAASAASAVNSPGTQATSTDSMSISNASKSFMLQQTGKAFVVGQWVSITDAANPATNWMTGAITAFNSGAGTITVNVSFSAGSGSISNWVVTQATATNTVPSTTANEGKLLGVSGSAVQVWANAPHSWANWQLITSNGGTFTVPDLVNEIRAYVFGKGGDGSGSNGGGGGGGGGCSFGTIPCKPGDVFTFDNTSGAVLKKGATAYLSANNGNIGSGATGGAGAAFGTVGAGLGISNSGATSGGAGGAGNGTSTAGAGGSSGSPLGQGKAGASGATGAAASGGGWGSAGNEFGGGGVGSAVATAYTLSGPYAVNSEAASRDWSNAFTDPLLIPCNYGAPVANFARYVAGTLYAINAPAGCGGGRTNAGAAPGGNGGLGGGGGCGIGSTSVGGHGGFGGGGGVPNPGSTSSAAVGGNGGIGGGGAGATGTGSIPGSGGSAAGLIFWG